MQGSRRRSVFTARLVNTTDGAGMPHVIDDLRPAILSGEEPPGTLIPIDAVAQFFGVSPIPVREALKVLTGEGLVDHTPHIGYSVAKLRFREFRELYEVRQALEAAALRAAVPFATAADDERATEAHRGLGGALEVGNAEGFHSQSRRFHLALIGPAGMDRLIHMYESAWNMTEPARPMSRIARQERDRLYDDHERMLAAFLARDADGLVAESALHFESLKRAIEVFRDDPEIFKPD